MDDFNLLQSAARFECGPSGRFAAPHPIYEKLCEQIRPTQIQWPAIPKNFKSHLYHPYLANTANIQPNDIRYLVSRSRWPAGKCVLRLAVIIGGHRTLVVALTLRIDLCVRVLFGLAPLCIYPQKIAYENTQMHSIALTKIIKNRCIIRLLRLKIRIDYKIIYQMMNR